MTFAKLVEKLRNIGISEKGERCEQAFQTEVFSGVYVAMPVSRRIFACVLVLVLTACVFLGVKYSWDVFSGYQQNHASQRQEASEYQASTAGHSPSACRPIIAEDGVFAWITCLFDNISTDGGAKQSEYELQAQQDMAAWAFGMLIVTLWLTVVTLLGVFFVWQTLKATQEMASETERIGNAQVSAQRWS